VTCRHAITVRVLDAPMYTSLSLGLDLSIALSKARMTVREDIGRALSVDRDKAQCDIYLITNHIGSLAPTRSQVMAS
jgi:hypothetical protein